MEQGSSAQAETALHQQLWNPSCVDREGMDQLPAPDDCMEAILRCVLYF